MKFDISAVAFDIDGTLYPAWRLNIRILPFVVRHLRFMRALNRARTEIRLHQGEMPGGKYGGFFDFQTELISKYLKKPPGQVKAFLEKTIYSGWKDMFKSIKPYRFAKEAVIEFKKRGLKIGILSDFIPEQKNDIWGILPYCDAVLGSEEVGALKPSPVPFKALADILGVPCTKILYVGNNIKYDVAGAKAVGMRTACIKNRFLSFLSKKTVKPDIYFSNYRQLLKFML